MSAPTGGTHPEAKGLYPWLDRRYGITPLIEFLKHVQKFKSLAFSKSIVTVGRGGADETTVRIQLSDAFVRISPVPRPISVHPEIAGVFPAAGTFARIEEPAL